MHRQKEMDFMSNASKTKQYALITGASHGIGKELARQCAIKGFNLLLVALPDNLLEDTAAELREKHNVSVESFGVDLTIEGAAEKVHTWFQELDVPLNFLINNAGFGTSGWFESKPIEVYRKMIRLNNEALMAVTHCFLPELKKQKKSHILNLGSMESFLPLPYKAVYAGTKQFNYGFSMALREEVRRFGISVSLLCPGPVITNEEGLKRIQSQGAKSKLIVTMPDYVAKIAIKKTLAGKSVIIPGGVNKATKRVGDIWPRNSKMRILERLFRVYVEKEV